MPSDGDLARVQQWMQAALLHPEAAGADRMIRASSRLSAEQRLSIYQRGYRLRLLECMRALYPALRHLLGPEVFDWFALDHLDAHPSRSYTLLHLDDRFVEHLRATRPDRDLSPERREVWPDFVIDLARLERTFNEVYNAAGTERGPVVHPEDLPRGPDDVCWTDAVLETAPCLRLLRTCFPAHTYLGAVRQGQDPELLPPRATCIAVNRRDYMVTITELEPSAYRMLEALAAGMSIGAAACRVPDAADAKVWSWLRGWAAQRFFATIVADLAATPTGLSGPVNDDVERGDP
ncbi:MAG: HvfC/BufC family peptide modification chaperone [Egibacteraceae bacterium]